ncbi:uracil-DNA glycosylase [Desulfosarcina cetonica]
MASTVTPPLVDLLREIRRSLVYLKSIGCTGFDCSAEGVAMVAQLGVGPVAKPAVTAAPVSATSPETLDQVRADLGECTRCPLCQGRTHIVFGEGDPKARLVFVGEGPGFEEDQSGHPFVGAAGQLLTKIIAAMQLSRETVYIANIVKCRPPGNRNPQPDEIRACMPFLRRQLAAIRPQVICALGKVAAQTLLDTQTSISRLRGDFHAFMDIPLMPTFHPAFLLRNPERKREVWQDVQKIMKRLSRPST